MWGASARNVTTTLYDSDRGHHSRTHPTPALCHLHPRPAARRHATAMATPLPAWWRKTHCQGGAQPSHDPMPRCQLHKQSPSHGNQAQKEHKSGGGGGGEKRYMSRNGKNGHGRGGIKKAKRHTNTAPVAYAFAYSAAASATAVAAGAASATAGAPSGAAPSTSTPRPRSSSDAMSKDDTMSSATLLAAARSSSTRAK